MIKKIRLFILSFITILWIWSSFADVIEPNTHEVDRCIKFQNVEIDWYKAIQVVEPPFDWEFYEIKENECLQQHYKFGQSYVYLVKKSINIDNLTPDNFEQDSILVDKVNPNWIYVDDSNPLSYQSFTYRIVKNWYDYKLEMSESSKENDFVDNKVIEESDNYVLESVDEGQEFNNENIGNPGDYALELVETEQGIDVTSWNRIMKFWIALLITILIETIILFIIAKLFRKKDQISNWMLILVWVLASTITLPLLRFVLPLFIKDWVEYTVIWELLVTLIEIFIIKYWLKVSRWEAILASIVCNLCSYLLGLFFF